MTYDSSKVQINPYYWVERSAMQQLEPGCFNRALGWDAKMFIYGFDIYGSKK